MKYVYLILDIYLSRDNHQKKTAFVVGENIRKLTLRPNKSARNPTDSGAFMYKSCIFFVKPWFTRPIVELEGVEPSSKQGNHTLSTCLFQPSVFELRQDLDHQPQPYPLKLHPDGEAHQDYFRFNRTAWPKSFGTTAFERCLVPSPGDRIKPVIYCTSIRQRERSCFRQINFWPSMIREYTVFTPHAYVPSQPAVKSSQPR